MVTKTKKNEKNKERLVISKAKLNHGLYNPPSKIYAGPTKVFTKRTGENIKKGIDIGLKKPNPKYRL
jgi:hypothetical protein